MRIFVLLMAFSVQALGQTVDIQSYDNNDGQYRYQVDISIRNATPSQIAAMPSNPHVSLPWVYVGENMWRSYKIYGENSEGNCDAWVVGDDIGILCYYDSP